MMERSIAEISIPQEFLDDQPEIENDVRKELSKTLMLELLKKYESGQFVMVRLPQQKPTASDMPWNGKRIRMDLYAKECIQCKSCERWGGRVWYEATLDEYTRGTCSKNLRQETVVAPPTYAITFASDFCSWGERRRDDDANGESNRDTEPDGF